MEIYLRLLTIDDDDKTIVARVAKFLGRSVRAVYRSLTKAREAAKENSPIMAAVKRVLIRDWMPSPNNVSGSPYRPRSKK